MQTIHIYDEQKSHEQTNPESRKTGGSWSVRTQEAPLRFLKGPTEHSLPWESIDDTLSRTWSPSFQMPSMASSPLAGQNDSATNLPFIWCQLTARSINTNTTLTYHHWTATSYLTIGRLEREPPLGEQEPPGQLQAARLFKICISFARLPSSDIPRHKPDIAPFRTSCYNPAAELDSTAHAHTCGWPSDAAQLVLLFDTPAGETLAAASTGNRLWVCVRRDHCQRLNYPGSWRQSGALLAQLTWV